MVIESARVVLTLLDVLATLRQLLISKVPSDSYIYGKSRA